MGLNGASQWECWWAMVPTSPDPRAGDSHRLPWAAGTWIGITEFLLAPNLRLPRVSLPLASRNCVSLSLSLLAMKSM